MTRRPCASSLLLLLAVAAAPAAGQEGPVTFEFSFANPGARSMGLGGAFAALADDATAAFANPAGLVQLIEPELSVEGRSWSYDTPFVQGGRAVGEPTGAGVDTVSGLRRGVSSSDGTGIPFSSLVYPADRWSIAVYRHTWADFRLASQIDGLFGVVDGELDRSEDIRARTEVRVVNTGLAGAYEITEKLSVGLGVAYFESEMGSFSAEFVQDEDAFFERATFAPELLDTTYSHQAKSSGFSLHAGFLWRASPQWSLGGYYRQGPRMTLRVIEIVGPADDEADAGTIELDAGSPLNLPDVFGLGVAFRTRDGAWTVSGEWTRVEYSSITEDLDAEIFPPGQIELADGDELHLGLEYVLVQWQPVLGLRLGAWRDPAHSVGSGPSADLWERTIFQSGKDEIHFSGGLGVVFKSFQVDLGVDLSDTADLGSLSIVYRF